MPCPCPPPKTSHNCPCNSFEFALRVDSNQNVEPYPTSNYDLIDIKKSDDGKEFYFSPKEGIGPEGTGDAWYDYFEIMVDGERMILPFNIYNNGRDIVIIGPDLER